MKIQSENVCGVEEVNDYIYWGVSIINKWEENKKIGVQIAKCNNRLGGLH